MVSGYYGFGNAGDELILGVLCEVLAGHRVTVLSADPAATRRLHGVEAVPRLSVGGVLRALAGADLLVSGGGGLLQDHTGPGSVPYYLGIILAARLLGCRVLIYAQGIGPLRRRWSRASLGLLRGVAGASVRDPESAEILNRFGVRGVEVTADAALCLPRPPRVAPEEVPELAGLARGAGPVLAVAPRPYGGAGFTRDLALAVDEAVERDGARVVLVPMQRREDVVACQALRATMRHAALLLPAEIPARRYPALFGSFDVVLGMRLHALILAALARVPGVGLSYDPKISAFVQALGPDLVDLPLNSAPERIRGALLERLAQAPDRQEALDAAVRRLQGVAQRNNLLLRSLLPPAP